MNHFKTSMPPKIDKNSTSLHRACLTCRRKKIRCPGEKPACSSCLRLNQSCSYKHHGSSPSEERLAYLEERLDLILNETRRNRQLSRDNSSASVAYSVSEEVNGSLEAPYSESDIVKGIDLYFKYCHRQPIWLFERDDIASSEEFPPHLIYIILALASSSEQAWKRNRYLGKARKLIMDQITSNAAELTTIESICLLCYLYFTDGELQLGQFHLNVAFQLFQNSMLHPDSISERAKRLFWSLQLLEQTYGQQKCLTLAITVWRPPGLLDEEDNGFNTPALPNDDPGRFTSGIPGIWSAMTYLGWVWHKTRRYVADCASNKLKEPWRHDSLYTRIYSDLVDAENWVPVCHRYDSVKFFERTEDEVKEFRAYWDPWLRSQFIYHLVHIALNHPFLYIVVSQFNPNLATPNTFWKRSSELALLHATWLTRLIDMVSEKNLQLHDPLFGHAAAVASTVHLHYCCAIDDRLKQKSQTDLNKCREFLRTITPYSKACANLDGYLDEMTDLAFSDVDSMSKIRLRICLIWDVLQFRSKSYTSLVHPSDSSAAGTVGGEEGVVEIIVLSSPEVTVNTADGGQAAPVTPLRSIGSVAAITQQAEPLDTVLAPADSLMLDTSWMWADPSQIVDQSQHDNISGTPEVSAWWNLGNL